jgi:two-component system sensor histidine kinase MtrB
MRSGAEIPGGHRSSAERWSGAWRAAEIPLGVRTARHRQLARRLVELHRLEQRREQPELSELDLTALVCAVCSDYPGVDVVPGPASALVLSDSRHLVAVLFAVLENALVHGATPVHVRIEPQAIVVADGGPGFSERLLQRATERFTTGSPAKGVGLGLALAVGHAELIGADLQLRNTPAGGAEVTIALSVRPVR